MTNCAHLGLKTLFCTNSCTLLKIAKKWCTQFENDETCWSPDKNAVVQTRALCWKSSKRGTPSVKMTKRGDLGLKTLFCTLYKRLHFAENHSKLVQPVAKWQNVLISGWKRCFAQTMHFATNGLEVVRPVWNRRNVLISGAKNAVLDKLVHFANNG